MAIKKEAIFTDRQIKVIKESLENESFALSDKLRPFLFDKVKVHRTSLGDNEAFPPEEDVPFDYKILKDRFKEVIKALKTLDDVESYDETYLSNLLEHKIKECVEIENAIRPNLEKLCTNVILKLFDIPSDTVDFEAKLVDEIVPDNQFRVKPEVSSKRKFDFESIDDMGDANKSILKRRLINSLIQGASYVFSNDEDLFLSEVYKLDKRLIDLYREIIILNDYLLFTKEEKITDKNPMQGGCVEVTLGGKKDKVKILAQGIIFPFLLHELIKGFLELFASHGLPSDNTKARYIVGQADFLIAEPWDLRMGVGLWKYIHMELKDTKILPFFFMNLCSLPTTEFNSVMKEVFAHTKKGKHILQQLIDNAEEELQGQGFISNIDAKNAAISLIADSTYTSTELDGMIKEALQLDADKTVLDYPNGKLHQVFDYEDVISLLEPLFGEPIGEGSSRIVFEIDDYQVIKVAYGDEDESAAGEYQNNLERSILTDKRHKNYSIFPKYFYGCRSDRWIVVEHVIQAEKEDFERVFGIEFDDFKDFIINAWHYNKKKYRVLLRKEYLELMENNKQMREIFNLVASHRLLYGDMLRLENWGLAQRNGEPVLVLLDAELNKAIHKEFY